MVSSKEMFDAERRMYINLRQAHPEWSEQKIRSKIYKSFYRDNNYRDVTQAEWFLIGVCSLVFVLFGIITIFS